MELFEAMEKRHSYRGPFKEEAVPREDLKRIVQAGIQAPSGRNAQTTSFVIVDGPEQVSQIAAMEGGSQALSEAKAYIACVISVKPEPVYEGHAFEVEDCAAAVENMLLAVTALGYATVWIDGWLRVKNRAARVGGLLGVPDGKVVRVLLPVGVPAEVHAQKEKKPFEARACFNRWAW